MRMLESAAAQSLFLEEKVANAMSRMRRVIRRCLRQIQADAAPMSQRVLLASALQNDYAEL